MRLGAGDIGIADHQPVRGIAPYGVKGEWPGPDALAAQPLDQLHVVRRPAQMRHEMHPAVLQSDVELPGHRGLERGCECVAALGVEAAHPAQVAGKVALHHEGLDELLHHQGRRRMCGAPQVNEAVDHGIGHDQIAKPQARKEHLAERAGIKHAT